MIHKYLLVMLALMVLVPATVFAADPQPRAGPAEAPNSVKILIGGQQVEGPIQKDDVVHEGRRIDGECDNPSIRIKARGDVKRVKVGPDDDCNIVVKVLELNTAQLPDQAPPSTPLPDTNGGWVFWPGLKGSPRNSMI